ncbi:hypothetical protein NHH82_06115 [Oxalobacteraceae bacterium OTU3REALA1]|nr:hypothetical protein NHH82_06115 [Oxalobacteraceae bacterium OTU3REALA1]
MEFVEEHGKQARAKYMKLFRRCRIGHTPVSGFTQSAAALISGKALYLKRHLKQRTFFLRESGIEVAAVIAFLPHSAGIRSLGGLLAVQDLKLEAFHMLLDHVLDSLGGEFLMPLNGHANFGISAVSPTVQSDQITILTSHHTRGCEALFTYPGVKTTKTYFALTTRLDSARLTALRNEVRMPPNGFSTRPISFTNFRRDIAIHGELVNRTMQDLDYFEPMSIDENWDLMGASWPLITPSLFQFLMYEGKEVGFCLGMLDFNQLFGSSGDIVATLKALTMRYKITRGRIMSTGILPEFRGKNLMKYVRNKVLLEFAALSVREVESSYVDEVNENSLGNVRSKGGTVSHTFSVFRSLPRPAEAQARILTLA